MSQDALNYGDDLDDFPPLDFDFKYENRLDYARFDDWQQKMILCRVPWDLGEAHVGQRVITGVGNVVHFGTEAERDAWFTRLPQEDKIVWTSKYKSFVSDDLTIDIPVPFDIATTYNYLRIEYQQFASDDSPLAYNAPGGNKIWHYFVRDAQMVAPNTTRLVLLNDSWTTWIYRINVSGMRLTRGHAPLAATTVADYLSNPVESCEYLLAADSNYGGRGVARHAQALELNDSPANTFAVIATTSSPVGDWGSPSAGWQVPTAPMPVTGDGVPGVNLIAMDASKLAKFIASADQNIPQFKQTVKAIFLAPRKLLNLGQAYTFCDTTCYPVSTGWATLALLDLDPSQFAYPERYADLAKLYTYPYAWIEIVRGDGQHVCDLRVEDTTGRLDAAAAISIAYPAVQVNAMILGTGTTGRQTINFSTLNQRTMPYGGAWYDTVTAWDVPTFELVLANAQDYNYASHYTRAQRALEVANEYTISTASAATAKYTADVDARTARDNAYTAAVAAKTTGDRSASAAQTNAVNISTAAQANTNADAALLVSNTSLKNTLDNAITDKAVSTNNFDVVIVNAQSSQTTATQNAVINITTTAEAEAEQQLQNISAVSNAVGGALNGAVSGAAMGGVGAAVGAIGGLVSAGIGAAAGQMSLNVTTNLRATQAETTIAQNNSNNKNTTETTFDRTQKQNEQTRYVNSQTVNYYTAQAAASSAQMINNATRTHNANTAAAGVTYTADTTNNTDNKTASDAQALNSYNWAIYNNSMRKDTEDTNALAVRDTALAAIAADVNQSRLGAPRSIGNANGLPAATIPQAMIANVVTQSKYAIAAAGDDFRRYGYRVDRHWEFDGWHKMRYWTYWECSDLYAETAGVPDVYLDELRLLLFGGVSVWRDPDQIGKRSIYDNIVGD